MTDPERFDERFRATQPEEIEKGLAGIREALNGLRFGAVLLTVHEGRIVQIDVTEKRRLKPN